MSKHKKQDQIKLILNELFNVYKDTYIVNPNIICFCDFNAKKRNCRKVPFEILMRIIKCYTLLKKINL